MKRLLIALALATIVSPALADEKTDAARDFMITCAKRLPETKKTVQILKDEGWRYESTDGRYHFYSQFGRRVIAATSVTSNPQQGCLSGVASLSNAGAVSVGKSVAKSLGLVQAEGKEPGTLAIWIGELNGSVVGLVAMPTADFGFMRGASVTLVQLPE